MKARHDETKEAREWVFARKPDDLKKLADVEELIHKTYTADIAYHLDDSAEEIVGVTGAIEPGLRLFTDSEAKHMNALRDAMVTICDKAGVDVHTISLKYHAQLNPIDSVDAYITANWPIGTPDDCAKLVEGKDCLAQGVQVEPCPNCDTYKRLAVEAKEKGIGGVADRMPVIFGAKTPMHKHIGDAATYCVPQTSAVDADGLCRHCGRKYYDVHDDDCPSDDCPSNEDKPVPDSEQHVIDSMRDECVFCGATLVEAGGRCPDRKAVEAGNLVAENKRLRADAIANAKALGKSPDQKLDDIVTALNSYSEINAPEIVRATVAAMDESSIGVLHGITGVFVHAVTGKPAMPEKWQKQIHGDLLDAFVCLAAVAHEERAASVTVEVRGGCAEVTSCPPNITVEIIDHDNH